MAVDVLSRAFAALGDPTRRAILERLAGGEATVGELAAPFAMSQQAVSQHVKVLEQAGLITRTRVAQTQRCTLAVDNLDEAAAWIGRNRKIWAERYDRLDAHIQSLRREPQTEALRREPQTEALRREPHERKSGKSHG